MVQGPSSGEDTISISSDDGLLSKEILAINAYVAQTEKKLESVSTNSVSEPQGQTEPKLILPICLCHSMKGNQSHIPLIFLCHNVYK